MAQVLIVDDEPAFAVGIAEFFRLQGHGVDTAGSLGAARRLLSERVPDVLLLDLMLPDGSGLDLLDAFEDRRPYKIVIITGNTGIKSLIAGMAGDGVVFMKKPIEPRELLGLLNAVTAHPSVGPDDEAAHFGVLLGESDVMHSLYANIRQVAPTDSTVFVEGESGTGKELVADALHRMSDRAGAFVPVNCGGLSQDLVSTQLFGHEKGSFTGAAKRHVGFFERANGGTLFLDEITEMPLEMQPHLLRVLESGRILRVGGEAEVPVDARVVAATNRDPAQAVRDGALREDLYFRLRVFPILLPPLRERRGDVSLLAKRFLDDLDRKYDTTRVFSPEMTERLEKHTWPGNVRELKHTVHRAYIMAYDDIVRPPERFEDDLPTGAERLRVGCSIADVEKELILSTLEHLRGDKKAAAASLGVSLKTLYNRLKEYGHETAD